MCQRAHEALLILLGHSSELVVEEVCGTLINLASDPLSRAALEDCGAAGQLVDALCRLVMLTQHPSSDSDAVSVASSVLAPSFDAPPAAAPLANQVGRAALLAAKTLCNLLRCEAGPDLVGDGGHVMGVGRGSYTGSLVESAGSRGWRTGARGCQFLSRSCLPVACDLLLALIVWHLSQRRCVCRRRPRVAAFRTR